MFDYHYNLNNFCYKCFAYQIMKILNLIDEVPTEIYTIHCQKNPLTFDIIHLHGFVEQLLFILYKVAQLQVTYF